MPYITLPALSANKVLTASYLNDVNANLRIISGHDHSGSAGEGNATVTAASGASPFVLRQEIICHISPSAISWNTVGQNSTYLFGAELSTNGTVAASVQFPISLVSGTYQLDTLYDNINGPAGSTAIFIGGASVGSIKKDTVGGSVNTVCSIIGINIGSTGSTTLQFAHATAGDFRIQAFKIRRTGN